MRKAILVVLVLLAAAAGLWWWRSRSATSEATYRFATVERGDLEALVSSTGTLEPVTTVSVGSQVSGLITALFVDFNDEVTEGAVIARLDPNLFEAAVQEAAAALARNRAELVRAEIEAERIESLRSQGVVPTSQLDDARRSLAVTRANVDAAEAGVARARRNLGFTVIRSPISGTVVSRAVDVGQTVAASLQAPELFRIAADLSRLQILAAVDESDIGRIAVGQEVRFAVQAYPDGRFVGRVRQVRLQPVTEDDVVHYTVVVDVENPGEKLLPGMTATVDFRIASVEDALLVPNAALRLRPTEAMLAEVRARRQADGTGGDGSRGEGRDGGGRRRGSGDGSGGAPAGESPRGDAERPAAGGVDGSGGAPGAGGSGARSERTRLFFLDAAGRLDAIPVRVGLTDGQKTAVEGPGLEAGLRVIVGVTQAAGSTPSNPFQPQSQGGGGFRRPPGGIP